MRTKRQFGSLNFVWLALAIGLAAFASFAAPPSGYYLVWNDEFDGSSLNGNNWVTYTGSHRDAVNTASALDVGSSTLTITTYTSGGTHYTGFVGTQGKFYSKFGYYEAYIDWADSPGMWSAFWLQSDYMDDCPYPSSHIGDTLTYGAEVDIVEHRSQNSSGTSIANQGVSNIHWDGYTACGGNDSSTGSSLYGSGLNSGLHTYGLLWDSSNYRFYVDGSQVYSTGSGNSEHSEWIVLSSEVLNGGWSGSIPGGGYGSLAGSSTKMQVAYVRYYAPNSMVFWDGSSSAYWTNTANWVAGKSVPSAGTAVFSLLSKGNYTTILGQDYTLDTLTILESSFITIKSNTLTINNLVDMNSAWNDASIQSDIFLGGGNTWRIGGGRTLRAQGNISGGHSITFGGYGTAALYGNNSHTLGNNVNRGTLRLHSDTALGYGAATVANGAQVLVYANINPTNALSLDGTGPNGDGALRVGAGANASWSGPITLANAATIKLDGGTALNISGGIGGGHTLTLASDAGSSGTVSGNINTGAFAVNKSGAGTWTLSGNNTFTGALNVDSGSTSANDGVVRIASNGAVGTAVSIQIRNNSGSTASSTLQLDGSSGPLSIGQGIALNGRNNSIPAIENLAGSNTLSGALTINVGGSDYRVQSDAGTLVLSGRISSAASGTRTLTFQGAGNILIPGVITNGSAGTLNLTKAGAGTLTLSAANTYNGATTNTGGTLLLATGGSISNSPTLFLDNGAIFDASQVGGFTLNAGQFLGGTGAVVGNVAALAGSKISPGTSAGTLTFSNNLTLSASTNYFDLANDTVEGSGTNDLIVVAGDLNLSGTNVILITPTVGSLANGRYKLIRYSGARTGGATNFVFAFNGFAPIATMNVDDSVTNEIDLVVFANPANLTWQGDGGANNWDIVGAANWFNGITTTQFNLGDKVTFDDSSANRTVNLVGGIAAGALTVNNSGNYTFQGAGKLTGASGLVKSNIATLTLLTTNNYSGPTTIATGTLQVGNGTASGSLGTGNILNNGALVFNHPDTITLANAIAGTGSLTKAGSGTMNLTGNNSFSGGLVQSGGIINASNSASLGSGPVLLTNLEQQLVFANGVMISNDITIGGPAGVVATGAVKGPASGSATLNGQIFLTVKSPNGGSTTNGGAFDGGNTSGGLILNGPIISSGGGSVHLRANRIVVSGGGSYNLFQDSGTVVLGAENGMATNTVLELGSSAVGTFDLAGFNQTLNGLQKSSSTGTVGNSSTTDDSTLTISGVTSNTTFAGTIQNSVSSGTRKVALTVSGGTFTLSAANTFSGDTRLVGGTLVLASSTALQNSPLNLAEDDLGALSFGSLTAATVGGLKGTRGLVLTNSSGANVTLTVGNGNTNTYTYSGSLSGGGSLTKTGSGTLILNGINTFTNVLNVDTAQPSSGNDGALRLASPDALDGASSIAIRNQNAATSTLQLDGSSGNITLPQAIALNGRNPASVSIENVAGDNTLLGNLSFGSGGTNYFLQSDSGTLTLSGVLAVHGLTSPRLLMFQGAGNFLVSGYITNSAVTNANILVKSGSGTLTLAGTNLYLGTTAVNGGALLVNGSISTNTVTVAGGILGGSGTIRGAVTVQSAAMLSAGAISGVTRTLTISNTLNLAGTTYAALDPTGATNDSVRGLSTVTYGGLLMLTNLSGSYSSNNVFKLFSAASYAGAFTNVLPATPAPGFAWNTNTLTTDGTLRIVQTAASTPTNIDFAVSGNQLTLSWPTNYLGWRLQYQTNDLSTGLGTNWIDVPDSASTNQFFITVDPSSGSVFYRMVFP